MSLSQERSDSIRLCNDTINLITLKSFESNSNIYFINVHENESTSLETVKKFILTNEGTLLYLKYKQTRNISLDCMGKNYSFDPNRIFSDSGRKNSILKLSGYSNDYADSIVKLFADSFLKRIINPEQIIAMHNNSDNNYSIKSYIKGGSEYQNAAKVYINKKADIDDFIFTTNNNNSS